MKICYIAPVSQIIADNAASQFLATLTNIIYVAGFGICGVVAFLRILSTYLKCKQIGDFTRMKTVLRQCAIGIGGLIALPYFAKLIDVLIAFIF